MLLDVTLITKCKILQPIDDLDSVEQTRQRNGAGCQNAFFYESYDIEINAPAKVKINTIEVEENYYESRIDFDAVLELARASMRCVRRKRKKGGLINQIEFGLLVPNEFEDFHTSEIINKLSRIIKK